nr:MAG: hydrolase [Vulcanisaeta sp. AZ3]
MFVLVDLDGTLLPLEAWDPVFQDASEVIAKEVGIDWRVVFQEAKKLNMELMRGFSIKAFDWDYIFMEVASRFGVSVNVDIEELLMRRVMEFKPYDGSMEFLKLIKSLGYGVIIATNGWYKYQSIVIERLGFSQFVDGIRTPDIVGCPKNCCEFFRDGIIMVGDNPLFDVYYPSMCGLATLFIGDWNNRLSYVRNVWSLDLSAIKPTYSFRSIKDAVQAITEILYGYSRVGS